jgi:hypothetical protein
VNRVFRGERDMVTVKPILEIVQNDLIVHQDSDEYARVVESYHDPSKAQVKLVVKHSYKRREIIAADTDTVKVKIYG